MSQLGEWGTVLKPKNKTLRLKIWCYLAIFSIFILALLWLFQGLFFDKYYEVAKSKELSNIADKLIDSYSTQEFIDILDELSYKKGICIEVVIDGSSRYNSSGYNRGCIIDLKGSASYKQDFIESEKEKQAYRITNQLFDNEILLYGIKLDDNVYVYINTSLVPLDSATILLKKQLIIISFAILGLSVLIAYFISKVISKPIEALSNNASKVSKGDYKGIFASGTDIIEIKNLEDNLNYMKDEFVKTDELRSDLLANVSHDLKTPLTMIKAYAEMVRDLTYDNEKKRNDNLNVIIAESERLNILVNDILTLSTIQAQTKSLVSEEFDLDKLIKTILKRYDVLVEQEHYQFIYENNEKNCFVLADYKQIEQVIYNILNNAINYTGDDNKVYIKVISNNNYYRVMVTDTGKGISDDEIKDIWTRYYHSDKKHKRGKIGTGLGLSIVKNILDNHKFSYGIERTTEKGTTFYFEILKANK